MAQTLSYNVWEREDELCRETGIQSLALLSVASPGPGLSVVAAQ